MGLGLLQARGLAGWPWRCLALWPSRVQESRQHTILQEMSTAPCHCVCHAGPGMPACVTAPVSVWKWDESLQSFLPCREEGAGPRGVVASAPVFVPLLVSLACAAPFQSAPACIPPAGVTAPVHLLPVPCTSLVGVRLLEAGWELLSYSGLLCLESGKRCARSAAGSLPSFPHL